MGRSKNIVQPGALTTSILELNMGSPELPETSPTSSIQESKTSLIELLLSSRSRNWRRNISRGNERTYHHKYR